MSDTFLLQEMDSLSASVASLSALTSGDGTPVSAYTNTLEGQKRMLETLTLFNNVRKGAVRMSRLEEAAETSDFPYLLGGVWEKALVKGFKEAPSYWRNYIDSMLVRDFRNTEMYRLSGGMGQLDEVAERTGVYNEVTLAETPYTLKVKKYGKKFTQTFESVVNDVMGAFDVPQRFGVAAARTVAKLASTLYVDADGVRADVFKTGNKNVITGNPALSYESLLAGLTQLATAVDEDGEPISVEMVHLVVPPQFEMLARNLVAATSIELGKDTDPQRLTLQGWIGNRVKVWVDPYISIIGGADGAACWFLFADPKLSTPYAKMGFLKGYENPSITVQKPEHQYVGGGDAFGSFETDGIAYRVRQIAGGAILEARCALASTGAGV